MRINNNIPALQALRHVQRNNTENSQIMEKLSSGLRINKAADDAAGLAISEKMRSQIRGLSQAERNVLDGVSLLQTTEGALNSIHSMLHRIRELAVQANNDTLTTEDRTTIQNEVDQLKKEIDRTALDTEFNTINTLAPPSVVLPPDPSTVQPGTADVVFFIDDSSTMSDEIQAVTDGIAQFVDDLSGYGDVKVATVSTVHEDRVLPLTSEVSEIKEQLENVHTATLGTSYPYEKFINYAPDGSKQGELNYRDGSNKIFVLLTDIGNEGRTHTVSEVEKTFNKHDIFSYVFGVNFPDNDNSNSINTFNEEYKTEYNTFANEVYTPVHKSEIAANITPELSSRIIKDTNLDSDPEIGYKDLHLQVGANSGEMFTIELFDARTGNLGIEELSVVKEEDREAAIEAADKAIEMVSSERAKFGAYQNALEHVHNNLTNTKLNVTASESQIRDADMAQMMTAFTKQNILNQSGTAMLAQANQLPQGVLQLLQ